MLQKVCDWSLRQRWSHLDAPFFAIMVILQTPFMWHCEMHVIIRLYYSTSVLSHVSRYQQSLPILLLCSRSPPAPDIIRIHWLLQVLHYIISTFHCRYQTTHKVYHYLLDHFVPIVWFLYDMTQVRSIVCNFVRSCQSFVRPDLLGVWCSDAPTRGNPQRQH